MDDSDINKKENKEVNEALENQLSESVRLRLVYDILTSSETDGGADISPNVDPYVESIMPLHNDDYNKVNKLLYFIFYSVNVFFYLKLFLCNIEMDLYLVKKMVN